MAPVGKRWFFCQECVGGESEGVAVGWVGEAGKICPTRFGWKIESCARIREGNGLMLGVLLLMLVPLEDRSYKASGACDIARVAETATFYFFLSPSIVRLDYFFFCGVTK